MILNPHAAHSTSPLSLVRSVRENRTLIHRLINRDVVGRYQGSVMGLLWSFFNPVLMLIVYTFVFSVVFRARWPGGTESRTEFALILFIGLMLFNLFSECISKAPSLILGSANYVKKVIFPLEILPLVALGSALFHFGVSLLGWMVFYVTFMGLPSATALLLPLVVVPLILLTLGLCWFLASLGVYLRDVGQVVGVATMVLMFMSPIFYPISALPEAFRPLLQLNPLTSAIEQARNVMIWGRAIDWFDWGVQLALSSLAGWLGFVWFQKTRKGFADVL